MLFRDIFGADGCSKLKENIDAQVFGSLVFDCVLSHDVVSFVGGLWDVV